MAGENLFAGKTLTVLLLGGLCIAAAQPRRQMREGSLRTGDAAPDFSLDTHDRKQRFSLSSFRGEKPVVLVFGSYT